jgi:PAS domain S-box-containing protein
MTIKKDEIKRKNKLVSNKTRISTKEKRSKVAGTDIDMHKNAEEALRLQSEITNNMAEGVILTRAKDAVIIYTNARFEEMFGYGSGELIGKNIAIVNAPTDKSPEEIAGEINKSLKETGMWQGEVKNIKKDGTPFWCQTNVSTYKHYEHGDIWIATHIDITERKQAEQALKTSEEKYRTLFEKANEGIIITEIETKQFKYVNPAICKMTGYTQEELIKLNIGDIHPKDALERIITGFDSQTINDKSVSLDIPCLKKDGTLVYVDINGTHVNIEGKECNVGFFTEITGRKQAENAMRESEEKYRLIVENSRDVIFTLDATGKVLYISSSVINELGYSPAELIGKYLLSLIHPEDTTDVIKVVQLNITNGPQNIDGVEFRFRHASGEWRWYFGKGTIVRDANGNFLNFTGIARDVTERRQAEKQLEQVAQEWRTTFDSITDLISIHDKDNRIVRVNKAMADLLKTTPQQLVGKFCHEVMHGTKEPPANCPHLQTLKTGKSAAMETFNPNFEMYFHEASSPLFNEKGEVTGSVIVARDVTKQKRMEEQLIVTDRLASIGELSSGIAHELNNPLTSVIGFSQLLMEGDIPANIKNDLTIINSEAQRAAVIVKNLLIFARKHAPVTQLSQINIVIEDVLRLRTYEQKVNNIEIEKHLASNLPEIMMDPFQIQQVFLNIIVNAEFAMLEAHQKGKLVITTERADGVIKITFTDDGPGITEPNLKSIFDPFFTTKEVGKGTGLGLSICHGIVTEHGGKIYARSAKGQGATFVVELPLNSQ